MSLFVFQFLTLYAAAFIWLSVISKNNINEMNWTELPRLAKVSKVRLTNWNIFLQLRCLKLIFNSDNKNVRPTSFKIYWNIQRYFFIQVHTCVLRHYILKLQQGLGGTQGPKFRSSGNGLNPTTHTGLWGTWRWLKSTKLA